MQQEYGEHVKKLEGRKDRRGYIQILNKEQISMSEYFIVVIYKRKSACVTLLHIIERRC